MSRKPRYVFDTNTLISAALLENSVSSRAFRRALQLGQVLLSSATLHEVAEVHQREKFNRYVKPREREKFLDALVARDRWIEPLEKIHAFRDPKDDKFLELAVEGSADCLVSGDGDLLVLNPFRGIPIQRPGTFLGKITRPVMSDEG